MEEREEGVWEILKELHEDVFELKQRSTTDLDDHVVFDTLAAELAVATIHTKPDAASCPASSTDSSGIYTEVDKTPAVVLAAPRFIDAKRTYGDVESNIARLVRTIRSGFKITFSVRLQTPMR
ncbi:hypothetical protein L226DRAFT_571710 [Lentinus tigrinus ALCF2SS1-7]|uniref:uncharacterized protein n=1 Tax=Lentinus tigrinus ALCF2SS1-7 TaxID=1328758 RepID=UPI001165E8A1|nr:hypothetical protein L226DRAFT_571710 [Lentinus tigrinus ALCF2SS1-7]